MKFAALYFVVVAFALISSSCSSVPASAAMGDVKKGMSKEEVRSVMQSHGLEAEDSRSRPSGGWEVYGQDPFAAGAMASEFERESGQRVESAEVYHAPRETGASVINLYYDGSGRLIR
ncbi:hypothetical protein [Haloferula sp.]|uniref:hypothetical protein n=1 Tax=Haloferula sp. TaxID=2497595 RepID=UPI00329FD701